ncbi:MAG: hypothetical protein IT293_01720 [Deltaproteobacteria bacterium]|nr:hypothetical protein [Deltaproteobacteria bacterium]
MSRPRKFPGSIVMTTGDGEPRTLEFQFPDGSTRSRLWSCFLSLAAGMLVMRFLDIIVMVLQNI